MKEVCINDLNQQPFWSIKDHTFVAFLPVQKTSLSTITMSFDIFSDLKQIKGHQMIKYKKK